MKRSINGKRFAHALASSMVIAVYAGAPIRGAVADDGTKKVSASQQKRSAISLQSAAARGDAEAMYWLAMLHIEGNIADADYDRGVQLLKKAASKGNKDAQRMYSFMDNAFSGDGC